MTPHAQVPRSERVLILIDFINPLDFPGAEKLAPPALRAARATLRLRDRMDKAGAAVIYSNDNYGVWQSDFHSLVAQCIGREGISGEIARLLAPRATDVTLLKPRHSAFYGSPLELLLKEMGARELVLCGLAADMCVQMTAADAFLRGGFELWVPADCIAAETPAAKRTAVNYMKTVLRCDVRTSVARRPASSPSPAGSGNRRGGGKKGPR
ncbi:MAG: isochorismatase (2,3 dihydro-2,3 dihydroxybenzoate synthase)-like protein [Ramlibacter sp.]|uniref:cysteine hydrolase family protein n=1 Tax=Ramlibacter sp. TaxID=1917967 RepID=UPI00261413F9|nr:isochorismatase family cysteine hydrolase [Ramlibacter sp.]MDB5751953.1 isochorismatase (2,3 dihydro-2,3 dihydroxybenzoate synthase)-like protein [Ramlibacter sp.]